MKYLVKDIKIDSLLIILRHKLVKNSIWMFIAYGGRVIIQAIYFIILARVLLSNGYGLLMGTMSLVGFLSPFAGWGSGNLLIMQVSRNSYLFPIYYGNAIYTVLISGGLLTCVVIVLGHLILPLVPLPMIIWLAISEFVFSSLLDISAKSFQAFENLRMTAILNTMLNCARLVAVVIFTKFYSNPTPQKWVLWYLVATGMSATIGLVAVNKKIGLPCFKPQINFKNIKEGFYFALGLSASSIYYNIDQVMLARLSTYADTGLYSAAFKIIITLFAPVSAVLYAAYARFFQVGSKGVKNSLNFAKKILPFSFAYGLLVTACLIMFAPIIQHILGDAYKGSVDAIRWLAPVIILWSIHSFLSDVLTGSGYQGVRTSIQVLVALVNVCLNVWLIPRYSWRGAAWVTLMSDGLMLIGISIAIRLLLSNQESKLSS